MYCYKDFSTIAKNLDLFKILKKMRPENKKAKKSNFVFDPETFLAS